MSARVESTDATHIGLNDEDIAYLMNLLRNANHPMTTQDLVDALRRQSGQRGAQS
jgi:hypothetical protein